MKMPEPENESEAPFLGNRDQEGHYKGKKNCYTMTILLLSQLAQCQTQRESLSLWCLQEEKENPRWTSSFPSIMEHFLGGARGPYLMGFETEQDPMVLHPWCPLLAFCLQKNFSQGISLIREVRKCRSKEKQSNKTK